jgi:NADP-dependent 3-hydroxy acid dehydrogenase YdfG
MPAALGRIAVVTGATSGIGEAIARRFVAAGFGVIGNGRAAGRLAALERALGPAFRGVAGDAAERATAAALLDGARQHFGREADLVVVNAGLGLPGPVTTADLGRLEEVLRLNLIGALALMQAAALGMVELQRERFPRAAADIVVIGSASGRHVSPFSAVYGATKFALHSLAEALRREVGPKGVRVSLVEPGIVLTGFHGAAGYGEAMVRGFEKSFGPLLVGEDVAAAVQYIVSQPPHVHLADVVVRPTRQDYP